MAKTAKRQIKKNNTKKMKGGFFGRVASWFSGNKEQEENKEENKSPVILNQLAPAPAQQTAQQPAPVATTHMGGRRRNTKKATRKAKKAGRKAKKGARKANKSRRTRK